MDDTRLWAAAHGHHVRELVIDQPDELSGPVGDLYRNWYADRGLPTGRLLVESFVLHDPTSALRSGRVPYWALFPVQPSLDRLRTYLSCSHPYEEAAELLSHGVDSIGLAWPGPARPGPRSGRTCSAARGWWESSNAAVLPTSEEMHIYPAMRDRLPDGESMVQHDTAEHQQLVEVMKELEDVGASDARFLERPGRLEQVLRDHVSDEESDQFPCCVLSCPASSWSSWAGRSKPRRRQPRPAPTRPPYTVHCSTRRSGPASVSWTGCGTS